MSARIAILAGVIFWCIFARPLSAEDVSGFVGATGLESWVALRGVSLGIIDRTKPSDDWSQQPAKPVAEFDIPISPIFEFPGLQGLRGAINQRMVGGGIGSKGITSRNYDSERLAGAIFGSRVQIARPVLSRKVAVGYDGIGFSTIAEKNAQRNLLPVNEGQIIRYADNDRGSAFGFDEGPNLNRSNDDRNGRDQSERGSKYANPSTPLRNQALILSVLSFLYLASGVGATALLFKITKYASEKRRLWLAVPPVVAMAWLAICFQTAITFLRALDTYSRLGMAP